MKIEILGTGCTKCLELEAKVKEAVARSGKFVQIKKVPSVDEIIAMMG